MEQYQIENNKLLTSFIERHYYNDPNKGIELFIRAKCPSNCVYCYFKKHGCELYPEDKQTDEQILNNLGIFLDYYIKKQFIKDISLFSGEFIIDGLFSKIMQIFYDKFANQYYKPRAIIISDDGDFIAYPEKIQEVEDWMARLDSIGIKLHFSLSVDGKYMDINRSRGQRDDTYYKTLIDFCDKHFFAFHPMVSAFNIDKWIDNYNWWKSVLDDFQFSRLMLLEVRDDNWTNDKIQEYLKFLNYIIEDNFKNRYHSNHELMAQRITNQLYYTTASYDPLTIPCFLDEAGRDYFGMCCTIKTNLCVRLGDLAIVPCHRTAYPQFVNGHFEVIDGKIKGIVCENYEILSAIGSWNRNSAPRCNSCKIKQWCHGGCLGSNFESTHELFIPPKTVCNFMQAKYKFLIMKYENMGLMPYIKNHLSAFQYKYIEDYMDTLSKEVLIYGRLLSDRINDAQYQGKSIKQFSNLN